MELGQALALFLERGANFRDGLAGVGLPSTWTLKKDFRLAEMVFSMSPGSEGPIRFCRFTLKLSMSTIFLFAATRGSTTATGAEPLEAGVVAKAALDGVVGTPQEAGRPCAAVGVRPRLRCHRLRPWHWLRLCKRGHHRASSSLRRTELAGAFGGVAGAFSWARRI